MAGFLRLPVCSRTILFQSRTFYTIRTIDWRHSASCENELRVHMLKRSLYMSKTSFPTVLPVHRICRLLLHYSYCRESSHTDSANGYAGSDRLKTKVDSKVHINLETEKQTNGTELNTILKDLSKDEFTEIKIHAASGVDEDELKQVTVKTTDNSNFDTSDITSVNNKHTDFEYDYQVAEDIEEYDYIDQNQLMQQQIRPEKVLPISLERGKNGVFDLDELITLLEHLGAENIVTFPVPPEANYCDHMVVMSAKSQRHLQAMNEELLWVHKRKKSQKDHHLIIEGIDKSNWCAMDMGNIVLHVFFGDAREYYNIESLWTLGPDQDPLCQQSSIDPYALSPEDMFWLETGNAADKVKDTAHQSDKNMTGSDVQVKSATAEVNVLKTSKNWPDEVTDSDAGWGVSEHTESK